MDGGIERVEKLTNEELAELFGEKRCEDISDDLYEEYENYLHLMERTLNDDVSS